MLRICLRSGLVRVILVVRLSQFRRSSLQILEPLALHYVLALLFTPDRTQVVLRQFEIRSNRL